jgi:hypothetical protein
MNLPTLAAQLNSHLHRLEAQYPTRYCHAGALLIGHHIETWTHTYEQTQRLTKTEATAYLSSLVRRRP